MVCRMTSMFNIAAGVAGGIVGGAFGTSWAMTQFWVYGTTVESCVQTYPSGFVPREALSLYPLGTDFFGICRPEQIYDWILIAPTSAAAALVGAFLVLLGAGILRKVYRT